MPAPHSMKKKPIPHCVSRNTAHRERFEIHPQMRFLHEHDFKPELKEGPAWTEQYPGGEELTHHNVYVTSKGHDEPLLKPDGSLINLEEDRVATIHTKEGKEEIYRIPGLTRITFRKQKSNY